MRTKNLPSVKRKQDPIMVLTNFRGLNNRNVSTEIDDNEAQTLRNIDFTQTDGIKKRNGTNIVANDKGADPVLGVHSAYYGNGSAHMLMASQSAATSGLWYRAGTGATWTEVTLNAGGTKLANANISMEDFYDGTDEMTFLADGTKFQKYKTADNKIYDATTIPGTSVEDVKILKLYKNRLYATGSATHPERVWFSALGDGDSWGADDWFQVPSESTNEESRAGDPITAVEIFQDRLFVFKNRSVWYWTGSSLRELTASHGCVGPRAVAASNNHLYFADNDGMYRIVGTYVEKVSKKIQGTWDVIPAARIGSIAMIYDKEKIYVATAAAGGAQNNIILVNYIDFPIDNERQQPWSYWSGDADDDTDVLAVSQFASYEATSVTLPILCYGSAIIQSTVIQLNTGIGDYNHGTPGQTVAIEAYYKTKDYPLIARYRKLFAIYKSQSTASFLKVTANIDFGERSRVFNFAMQIGGDVYGTGVYGTAAYGGQNAVIAKGSVSNRGRYINYNIHNSSIDQPWTLWELKQIYKKIQLR